MSPGFFFLFGVPGGFIGICRIVRWNRCFFRMVWNHRLSIISHIMVYDTLCTAWIKKGSRFSFIKIFWTQHQTRKTWASMMSDLNHNALLRSFFLGGVLLSCLRLHSTPRFFFVNPVGLDAKHRFRNHQCCLLHPFEEDTHLAVIWAMKEPFKTKPVVV